MKLSYLLFVFLLMTPGLFNAQEDPETEDPSLEAQFDRVYSRSNNYQHYKVVKRTDLRQLKKSALDSLSDQRKTIDGLRGELAGRQSVLDSLRTGLRNTEEKLEASLDRENNISFLGYPMSKAGYNSLMWVVVAALAFFLGVFVYKYKNNNAVRRELKEKLHDMEGEFEGYRQRSLEREQQLNRKLLDEMNKQKQPH